MHIMHIMHIMQLFGENRPVDPQATRQYKSAFDDKFHQHIPPFEHALSFLSIITLSRSFAAFRVVSSSSLALMNLIIKGR